MHLFLKFSFFQENVASFLLDVSNNSRVTVGLPMHCVGRNLPLIFCHLLFLFLLFHVYILICTFAENNTVYRKVNLFLVHFNRH